MTISRYLAILREDFGVIVTRRGIRVPSTMPTDVKLVLAGYRAQLDAYAIDQQDHDLDLAAMRDELLTLGLMQMNGVWTHPEGDAVADQIVTAVLTSDTAGWLQVQIDRLAKVTRLFSRPTRATIEFHERPGTRPGQRFFYRLKGHEYADDL